MSEASSWLAEKQIKWEFHALRAAKLRCFWFAAEAIQPIALFELGAWLTSYGGELVIGCHPDYSRRQDVVIQTRLARPDLTVVDNIEALASLVRKALP
jgi:hypothetical protein